MTSIKQDFKQRFVISIRFETTGYLLSCCFDHLLEEFERVIRLQEIAFLHSLFPVKRSNKNSSLLNTIVYMQTLQ